MKHRIKPGHDSQQSLRGAHVRGRLLAPDMLLAGLKGQPVSPVAQRIDGNAYDPPGHIARIAGLGGHISRMGPAITHRDAEALGAAHGDISPHRAGLLQQGQRQRIRRDDADGLMFVQCGHLRGEIAQGPMGAGKLEDRAKNRARVQIIGGAHGDLDPQWRGPRLYHRDVLRVAVFVNEEALGF